MNTINIPVYEFRPVQNRYGLYRYNDGNWIPDDGEYDLAFYYKHTVLGVDLPYYENLLWKYCYNGNWGAFEPNHPRGNAWHCMTQDNKILNNRWKEREKHPNYIAFNKTINYLSSKLGCVNGSFVEFNILDKTIKNGLLRNKETKQIIKIPSKFNCIYCGEIDYKD